MSDGHSAICIALPSALFKRKETDEAVASLTSDGHEAIYIAPPGALQKKWLLLLLFPYKV